MLARRELSAAQVAARLRRRGFDDGEVEAAVARLRDDGSLDDVRTATVHARRLAGTALRGPLRAEREIAALGIGRAVARAAVAETYAERGVATVLEQALARRLPAGATIANGLHFARLYRYLIRQGFEPRLVNAALRNRGGASAPPEDEESA